MYIILQVLMLQIPSESRLAVFDLLTYFYYDRKNLKMSNQALNTPESFVFLQ